MGAYLDCDEFGVSQVRCMCCNTIISTRTYIDLPSREELGCVEKVMAMSRYGNYRTTAVTFSDGGYANILHCADCVIHDSDLPMLEKQIKGGWLKELAATGRDKSELDKHQKRVKHLKLTGITHARDIRKN